MPFLSKIIIFKNISKISKIIYNVILYIMDLLHSPYYSSDEFVETESSEYESESDNFSW